MKSTCFAKVKSLIENNPIFLDKTFFHINYKKAFLFAKSATFFNIFNLKSKLTQITSLTLCFHPKRHLNRHFSEQICGVRKTGNIILPTNTGATAPPPPPSPSSDTHARSVFITLLCFALFGRKIYAILFHQAFVLPPFLHSSNFFLLSDTGKGKSINERLSCCKGEVGRRGTEVERVVRPNAECSDILLTGKQTQQPP